MNFYKTSDGVRISKKEIDANVTKAKKLKIQNQLDSLGYNVCEDCFRNDCKPIDCSHNISVDECQKMGKSELAWDLDNITIRGRRCHQHKDGLYLGFSKKS